MRSIVLEMNSDNLADLATVQAPSSYRIRVRVLKACDSHYRRIHSDEPPSCCCGDVRLAERPRKRPVQTEVDAAEGDVEEQENERRRAEIGPKR